MATEVDILAAQSDGTAFNPARLSSAISSGITYNVGGYSAIIAQIDTPLDSAAAGTITLQCSLDGANFYNFPSGAITYTTTGVQAAVNVEGLVYVRYQVTSTSGTVEYMVTVTGVRYV